MPVRYNVDRRGWEQERQPTTSESLPKPTIWSIGLSVAKTDGPETGRACNVRTAAVLIFFLERLFVSTLPQSEQPRPTRQRLLRSRACSAGR